MKKHKRIQGNQINFADLGINSVYETALGILFLILKNGPFKKVHIEKNIVLLNFLSWDMTNSTTL